MNVAPSMKTIRGTEIPERGHRSSNHLLFCDNLEQESIHKVCSHRPSFIHDLRLLKFLPTLLLPLLLLPVSYLVWGHPAPHISASAGFGKQSTQRPLSASVETEGVSARVRHMTTPCFLLGPAQFSQVVKGLEIRVALFFSATKNTQGANTLLSALKSMQQV